MAADHEDRPEAAAPPPGSTTPAATESAGESAGGADRSAPVPQEVWTDAVRRARDADAAVDLPGTERLGGLAKLWLLHPYALLAIAGYMSLMAPGPFLVTAVFAWVAFVVGSGFGRGRKRDGSSPLLAPSAGLKGGFRALGFTVLAAVASSFLALLGLPNVAFYVLNGAWVVLTAAAVHQASRTDAQTGWMVGATSMAAACAFFGIPLALIPGVPWPMKLIPFLCAGSAWQTWNYLSSRGAERTRSALKALSAASLATLCYLSFSALVMGFSLFEATCHFSIVAASFLIPLKTAMARLPLAPADPTPALPAPRSDADPNGGPTG
ncbi:MAG: hypothetical protein HY815_25405 [Candidatus Riflebacteria bacterium]|nr:hypothetical protein [Candidatus Riflebacteria bacterium]